MTNESHDVRRILSPDRACTGSGQAGEVIMRNVALYKRNGKIKYKGGEIECPECGRVLALDVGHSVPVDDVPTHAATIAVVDLGGAS